MSRPEISLTVWLEAVSPGAASASVIGGKGASLARLASGGFRIPPGFCLTTAAFEAQVAGARIAGDETAAAALERSPLVPPVAEALRAAIDRLVAALAPAGYAPRFAVRSSAVAEDGSATSYAGLHETELDVPPEGIDAAVRRCWASLWSPAAVAYRRRRSLSPEDAAMAVVVQALVPAEASAVVFTRHPVTARDDQLVVTSTRGLGDAMVAGTITPDTTVVAKDSRAVVEFDPGDGADGGAGPALTAQVLDELVALSLRVEQQFGVPVDIEAAYARGTWFLLQARPITTGSPADAPAAAR